MVPLKPIQPFVPPIEIEKIVTGEIPEIPPPTILEPPMKVQFARVYSATTVGGGDGGRIDYGTFVDETNVPTQQNLGVDAATGLTRTQLHLQSLDHIDANQPNDSSTSGDNTGPTAAQQKIIDAARARRATPTDPNRPF